ncbi:MAG: hypothetical protein U9R40_04615 [Synergistota bacterium]|nr:hypothetical protein [Synergistota bacterium]
MIVSVDPGTCKFGWAVANDQGDLAASGVMHADDLEGLFDILLSFDAASLKKAAEEWIPRNLCLESEMVLLLGSGTGHRPFLKLLEERGLSPVMVAEDYSTLEARKSYWRLHPPTGFRKLLPESMRAPPRPIDDLAAWIIIKRFLKAR